MNNSVYDTYNIKIGDTLYDISKRYNINPELLALINGLNLNDYIYDKQEIIIPKKDFSYYFTKSEDNIEEILKLFNTNYSDFSKYNDNIVLADGQLFAYKR